MRTVASPPARPPARASQAVALLACVAVGAPPARGGDPGSATGCVVPVFVDDDATLIKAYDGLRLGLEEANLPRACRKAPATDDAAGWALAAREARDAGAPFVVALGRGASASVAATAFEGAAGRLPCVYVDLALSLGFAAFPDPPRRPAPFASVRAELPFERLARVVLDLLPGRPTPTALLPWSKVPPDVTALLARAEAATGVRWSTDASVPPDVILDLPLDAGETREPFAALLARARSAPRPAALRSTAPGSARARRSSSCRTPRSSGASRPRPRAAPSRRRPATSRCAWSCAPPRSGSISRPRAPRASTRRCRSSPARTGCAAHAPRPHRM